jgi:hypothetical protein
VGPTVESDDLSGVFQTKLAAGMCALIECHARKEDTF